MDVFCAAAKMNTPTSTTKPWKSNLRVVGPTRYMAMPPMRLAKYSGRTLSGMIITAKNETNEVNSRL